MNMERMLWMLIYLGSEGDVMTIFVRETVKRLRMIHWIAILLGHLTHSRRRNEEEVPKIFMTGLSFVVLFLCNKDNEHEALVGNMLDAIVFSYHLAWVTEKEQAETLQKAMSSLGVFARRPRFLRHFIRSSTQKHLLDGKFLRHSQGKPWILCREIFRGLKGWISLYNESKRTCAWVGENSDICRRDTDTM